MDHLATGLGLGAVVLFVLSYQVKKRRGIVALNAASRVLYVAQYVLLGAFEGALLDLVAFVVSVASQKQDTPFVKKHFKAVVITANVFIVAMGLLLYQNIFSLLPIFGVIFETMALWLRNEKHIRFVSFFGAPFWLAYNLVSRAYGSAIGNVLTICSIAIAVFRYDVFRKNTEEQSLTEKDS